MRGAGRKGNTYVTTLGAKEMPDMPLRAQRYNNLAFNRRLTTLASRTKLFMVVQMAIEPSRIVPAIVFGHLSLCSLVVVVIVWMISATSDALETCVAVGGGLGVEGGVFERGGAVGAEEAGRVKEGG